MSRRSMHREARALVPTGARLVQETESACAELRSYPSCVIVSFDLPGTEEARERAMQGRLRMRGWTPAPDTSSFVYERDGLRASVRIQSRGPVWEERCADKLANELDLRETSVSIPC